MSESEDEELAALRRERTLRLGASGMTVSAMRHSLESRAREALKGSENGDTNDQEDLGERRRPDSMERQHEIREEQEDNLDVEEDEFDIPSELRAQLPLSFGGSAKVRERGRPDFIANPSVNTAAGRDANQDANNAAEMIDVEGMRAAAEEPEIGPPRPPDDGDGDDDDDSFLLSAREDEDLWQLPVTSEAVLEPHSRAVICLAWDESGSRLLSGSNDYSVKIFDFGGMKSDCRPFRSLVPCDGHPVIALSWSPNGDAFLAVTTSNQPKVYDRDGKEQGEFPLGDMYIRDMKNTKGHIAPCRGGTWHPKDKGTGLTCSEDGTLRVWDLWTLEQKTVIKPTLLRPRRVPVTACCYSSEDGSMIAGGLQDGTLQLWDVRGKFGQSAAVGVVAQPKAQMVRKQTWTYVSRTGHLIRNGHEPETDITSLSFSKLDGGKTLLSRGSDGTVKLWDVRKFESPITEAQNLPTGYATTGCCFSPDERLVLTGMGVEKKGDVGSLTVLDRSNLSIVRRLVMQGSVVAVAWHPRLNQIAVGCGDRKEGAARILYDSSMSIRGALMALGRRPRKENTNDYRADIAPRIYNPNALPLFREDWPGKGGKRRQQDDFDDQRSKVYKPDKGLANIGVGTGGALGASGGSLLTQYILKNQGKIKKPEEEDIRASILRHASKADEYSSFTKAYEKTQPKRIYANPEEDDDDDDDDEVVDA